MSKAQYVTTSIAYVNAKPHIGFAMEVIEADAIARYHRLIGNDTFYLTGTDEHGSKLYKTALEQGKTPIELCDENAVEFEKLKELLCLSNDDFIRTTDQKRHWPAVHKIWNKLVENGDIYKDKYVGYYCSGCEAYIGERDLVDGHCPNHKTAPEQFEEENYFFRLSKYSKQIQELIESKKLEIIPEFRAKEILNVIKEGLQDVSFSRPKKNLPWGVPVPNDPDQVMYVWCDALTNYLSAIGYAEESDLFKKLWPHVIHVIGKDIVRFHAAIWPAMHLSAGLPTPEKIVVHGFITSEGHKMSKSLGNVVDPYQMVKDFGVDSLRYYLLSEIPIGKDGDFSMKLFKERYNAHLANNLGNLVNRVISMSKRYEVEVDFAQNTDSDNECKEKVEKIWDTFQKNMDNCILHEGIANVWELINFANKYIDNNKPWKLIKTDPKKTQQVLKNLLEIVRHIALLLSPFLPKTSKEIFEQLNIHPNNTFEDEKTWNGRKDWKKINEASILFPRLEDDKKE